MFGRTDCFDRSTHSRPTVVGPPSIVISLLPAEFSIDAEPQERSGRCMMSQSTIDSLKARRGVCAEF